jgi:hypothetical protein
VVSAAISVTCFKNALNKTDEVNTSKKLSSLGHSYEIEIDLDLDRACSDSQKVYL